MTKDQVIHEIAALTEDHERAIDRHPAETAAVYRKGRDAFIEGQRTAGEAEWSRAAGLSVSALSVVNQYMLSSSFISAWYHLTGEKGHRDKAANSCAVLVSSMGINGEDVMRKYIKYERLWRETMKQEGIVAASGRGITLLVAAAIVIALIAFVF